MVVPHHPPHLKKEFGGTPGAIGVIIFLPLVVLFLHACASKGALIYNPAEVWSQYLPGVVNPSTVVTSCAVFLSWLLFHVVLTLALPGDVVDGSVVQGLASNGGRLKYIINGHLLFWFTLSLLAFGWVEIVPAANNTHGITFGTFPLDKLYELYSPLAVVGSIFSFCFSVYLYVKSFSTGKDVILAKHGQTGSVIFDFFIGRELNPRVLRGALDLKQFCELKPGLIGWVVLNLSHLSRQYSSLGYVTGSMILVNCFQGFYVWDALFNERAILSTMDITTDGFGFMLAFGDLVWVPFSYSLQSRYLVEHDPHLPLWALACVALLNFGGLYIFRGANGEKDDFRRDPEGKATRF